MVINILILHHSYCIITIHPNPVLTNYLSRIKSIFHISYLSYSSCIFLFMFFITIPPFKPCFLDSFWLSCDPIILVNLLSPLDSHSTKWIFYPILTIALLSSPCSIQYTSICNPQTLPLSLSLSISLQVTPSPLYPLLNSSDKRIFIPLLPINTKRVIQVTLCVCAELHLFVLFCWYFCVCLLFYFCLLICWVFKFLLE